MADTSARDLSHDFGLIAGLVGLDVATRILPHAPNLTAVAASALFAAVALRRRWLAPLVPLAAMAVSDVALGFYALPVTLAVYAGMMLPALLGLAVKRPGFALLPASLAGSLGFFALSNAAVWASGGMYAADLSGLVKCYVAALPFLQNTLTGDLGWGAALFGGYFLARRSAALLRPSVAALPRLT